MPAFKKILIIDDDVITRTICERTMKFSNFTDEVAFASNGNKAKEYLLDNTTSLPGVIFLDIHMVIMNGWEFLDWFNAWANTQKIHLPVYVLSSSVSKEDADLANTYNMVYGYITKPIMVQHLNEIAAKVNEKSFSV